jgi:hypothetical protein
VPAHTRVSREERVAHERGRHAQDAQWRSTSSHACLRYLVEVEQGESDTASTRHHRDRALEQMRTFYQAVLQIEPQLYRGNYVAFVLEAGTLSPLPPLRP